MLALMASITISLDPVLVKLGSFSLRWYGLMYVVGIAIGLLVLQPYARRRAVTSDQLWNIFWGVAIAALVGGRLYYVLQSDPGSYVQHPGDLFAFWQGGMAFYGAIFLGIPVLLLLAYQQRVPLGVALDCVALFAPLSQAVGRIGNIINGDIVGYPSNAPWATIYTNSHSFAPLNTAVQPAAAYELLFGLALFAVLWPLRFRVRPAGMLFVLYLSLYNVGQFFLFIVRDNEIVLFHLKQAQVTAIAVQLGLIPVAWLIARRPWWFDPAYAGDEDDADEREDEADASDGSAMTDQTQDDGITPGAPSAGEISMAARTESPEAGWGETPNQPRT
ncbi:MAG TPA: prolipoprotein diacylglyceryl transferase [Chloroflexota bacterium]